MSSLSEAVDQLFAQVKGRRFELKDIHSALQRIAQQTASATKEDLDAALQRMEELVTHLPLLPAALVATGCGVLIENGGSTEPVSTVIVQRTCEALQLASVFVHACQNMARQQSDGSDPNDGEMCVEAYGEQISGQKPAEAQGWAALTWFCPAANAVLMRDVHARERLRTSDPLMTALRAFPLHTPAVECVRKLTQVLEHEELVVLHPALQRGYRVRISGLADNFQLHTLLADALISDPSDGWLPGERPDPVVVAAAKDGPCPRTREENRAFPTATGAFNLWNWQGLQPDGSLPTGTAQSRFWIWNEGTPADIAAFEGTRIVLLGPPSYMRSWSAGRPFPGLAGRLEVLEIFTHEQTADWLARLAAAQR